MAAVRAGDFRQVRYLLARGSDPNKMIGKDCLLVVASAHGRMPVVVALVKGGANVNVGNANGIAPLEAAVGQNHTAVELYLLAKGARVNARDRLGGTPLSLAMSVEAVKPLLRRGADPNAANADGQRPLHAFVSTRNPRPVDYLLRHGAQVDARDRYGNPALIYVAQFGHPIVQQGTGNLLMEILRKDPLLARDRVRDIQTARILIHHGADATLRITQGKNAIDIATERHYTTLVAFLKATPRKSGAQK